MNIDEIIEFAYRLNNKQESAQAYCAKTKESIKKDIMASIENNSMFLCYEENKLNGLLVLFKDETRKTCDCFMLIESNDYEKVALKLFLNLNDREYAYNFFFPIKNENCINFLEKIKAKREINEYHLQIQKNDFKTFALDLNDIFKITLDKYQEFTSLYNEIFEDIYISAEEVLNDQNHETFIMQKDGKIIALAILRKNLGDCGTAEIIGVKKEYRGIGNGKKILSYLLNEAFKTYEKIDLIVDGDNYNAIKLYTNLGFKLKEELCFYKYQAN